MRRTSAHDRDTSRHFRYRNSKSLSAAEFPLGSDDDSASWRCGPNATPDKVFECVRDCRLKRDRGESLTSQRCFALAVIFIPLFIICELASKTPVVNLRLLRIRNLGLASAVNFLLGASLYGSVFLLPEYLEQVQNYSARQTGEAMVLIGLPQLLIFPFVPRLMKAFDLRLIVFAGR